MKVPINIGYATRWAPNNLARSAYDGHYAAAPGSQAQKQQAARSPAIDTGSRDFLNGGWTRTDQTLPYNQLADNPPSPHGQFGDPDNMAQNGTLGPWDDSNKKLDLGYHYRAAPQNSGTVYTTLRHPKERIPSFGSPAISPNVTKSYHLALAAGEDSNGNDQTVAVFKTTDVSKIGYRVFRGNSTAIGTLQLSQGGLYQAVAATGSPNDGKVYAAAATWDEGYVSGSYWEQNRRLEVHRYEADGTWTCIAEYDVLSDLYNLPAQPVPDWPRVALVPTGDHLYIFWVDENPEDLTEQAEIRGAYLENAAFVGTPGYATVPVDLGTLSPMVVPLHLNEGYPVRIPPSQWESILALEGEWDDAAPVSEGTTALPRIVYVDDYQYADPNGTQEVWAARVQLVSGIPVRLATGYNYALASSSKWPALTMRRSDSRFSITSVSNRAFCRLRKTAPSEVERWNLNNPGISDDWADVGGAISDAEYPAVTSRAFGTERLFYVKASALVDDLEGGFPQSVGDAFYPKLDSQKSRLENTYLAHRGASSDVIDLYQLEP